MFFSQPPPLNVLGLLRTLGAGGSTHLSFAPNLACDIQKLYDKDPLGNVLIDKKKLEKILLLSYVCNSQAGVLWC